MKLFSTCAVILAIFSCSFGCSSPKDQLPSKEALLNCEKIADTITEKTAEKLKEQKNLHLVTTGRVTKDDIRMMLMGFHLYTEQEVDVKEARELLVYAVNEYLLDINSNEEIRPCLHEYPFTAKNVEIRIWVYNPERIKIGYISAINGLLTYQLDLPETQSRQDICKESYEEALQATFSQENDN
ncbi:hypothetical protein [Candidatus Rhabdochlamydia sp. T3358]|uniref:hypothetical protein n=1 Tax=Candidatus Rhabdochlamydia sp. T3358 TaxID=2099795 RepID=UPI0010BC1D8C|nr:hypothetical protein [Candidatus Rhabdochlamydia sp. T3358]VHO00910.1 hypothetical protein RHT_00230 [Candidatus Rhabdochlamydia sp. T3358]